MRDACEPRGLAGPRGHEVLDLDVGKIADSYRMPRTVIAVFDRDRLHAEQLADEGVESRRRAAAPARGDGSERFGLRR